MKMSEMMKILALVVLCFATMLCNGGEENEEPGVTVTLKWSFSTGGSVYSNPAIGGDGTIYVGSCDHKLYAINPDGTEKWRYSTG